MRKSKKTKRASKAGNGSFSKWLSSVPTVRNVGPVTINVPIPMHRWLWFQVAEAAAVNGKTIGQVIEHLLYKNGSGLSDWSTDGFKM
jgi:hypothetical protein